MTVKDPSTPAGKKTRVKMWVEYPAGTKLSKSQSSGGYSPLARDVETNDLETHATLFPVDDDEDKDSSIPNPPPVFDYVTDEGASDSQKGEKSEPLNLEEILELLELLYAFAKWAERTAPKARAWWNQQALPVVKSTWGKVTKARREGSRSAAATVDAAAESLAEEHRVDMDSTEARERFVAALAARLFSDEQLRVLRRARIKDDGASLELSGTMNRQTLDELQDNIRLMVETHPGVFGEELPPEESKSRPPLRRLRRKG
jgi:hypothetical protein